MLPVVLLVNKVVVIICQFCPKGQLHSSWCVNFCVCCTDREGESAAVIMCSCCANDIRLISNGHRCSQCSSYDVLANYLLRLRC